MRLIRINLGFVTNSSSINYLVPAGGAPLATGLRPPGPEDVAFLRDLLARLQAYFAQRFLDLLERPAQREGVDSPAPAIDPERVRGLGAEVGAALRGLKAMSFWCDGRNHLVGLGDTNDWGGDYTWLDVLHRAGLDGDVQI